VVRIVESVAVDPEHDRLFVAEEQEGRSHVKVYSRAGHFRGAIPGALFPSQAEGIALYACTRGGYVVMTDQSRTANAFHVFERATLRHVGSFGLAGVSNTDGIAVTSRSFGRFAAGAMYAVDDDGRVAAVSWARIARVLGLEPRCDAGAAGLTSPRGTD
jgi:3-phytase